MLATKIQFNGKAYIQEHGNAFDRGSADSWYGRPQFPHKGGVGGLSGERTTDLTEAEVDAYFAGYEYNEQHGGKKSWD